MAKYQVNLKDLAKYKSQKDEKGWHSPRSASKKHYFLDGRSLCKAMKIGWNSSLIDNNHSSPGNCSKCKRLREGLETALEYFKD